MSGGISDLGVLLRSMQAALNEGCYVYCQVDDLGTVPLEQIIALIREPEGITVVLAEADAIRLQLPILFRAAWITLQVHSDLAAVGLTAAFQPPWAMPASAATSSPARRMTISLCRSIRGSGR